MKTIDNSTSAALPGGLKLSRRKYVKYFGRSATDRWFYHCCSRLPWIARHLPAVGTRVHHWVRTREHLEHGCLNPAMLINAQNGVVAVFTSLTAQGEKPMPVVKIQRERIDVIDHLRPADGSRFAAASVYSSTRESWARGQWSDFFPIVVDCLVDDRRSCEEATARIKPLAWKALELALQDLGTTQQEGLFPVNVPDKIVWNAY